MVCDMNNDIIKVLFKCKLDIFWDASAITLILKRMAAIELPATLIHV